MPNSRIGRYIIIAALIVGCGAVIVLIADSYGQGPETLASELLAILLLLAAAMGAGFLAALGLRAIRNARDKTNSHDDE